MRLIGYIRVSTEEQAEQGHSLGQQPLRLAQYCELHGHQLVEVIGDEGVSGSVPLGKRPGGTKVLRSLREGRADGVVIYRLDRMFRDALDGLQFFRGACADAGAVVHSVSEHIDTGTPQGKLNLGMQLLLAEYERDLAVLRATDNSRGLRQSGKVYGHVPYGCVAVNGQLFRDLRTWDIRCSIVEYAQQGLSLSTIAGLLHDQRVAPPGAGRRWARSSLAHVINTHGGLTHLPLAGQKYPAGQGDALEVPASPLPITH